MSASILALNRTYSNVINSYSNSVAPKQYSFKPYNISGISKSLNTRTSYYKKK